MRVPLRLHKALLILLALSAGVCLYALVIRLWFELQGVMHSDAFIFHTVGRGIVNGLIPYADLFETKPPGIFLMHAASIWLFDSQLLVSILQAAALVALPILVLLPSIDAISDKPAKDRQLLSVTIFVFALLLTLFTADQAGTGLTESYGAALGVGYLYYLHRLSHRMSRIAYGVLGVLLLLAAGLKEPFALSILAGVIVLSDDWKSLVQKFLIPLLIAAIVGITALAVLGYLEPFFTVYLKHMTTFHVYQHTIPIPIRALEFWRVFFVAGAFSWMFAISLCGLWFWYLVEHLATFRWLTVLQACIASYLALLAIAIGGDFYGHHFVFAVPFYAAVLWLMVRRASSSHPLLLVAMVLLALGGIFEPTLSYAEKLQRWTTQEDEYRSVATLIDEVMENCGYEKYLQMITRGGGPYAFTTRSPYGPIFVHYTRFIGGSKDYQSKYIAALKEAPLIFMTDESNSNLTEYAHQYMGVNFTKDPPPCVGEDFKQPQPYDLLFSTK